MEKSNLFQIIIGALIFISSLVLAIVYHYNRFYTLLLLGMFLILNSLYKIITKKELLNKLNFFKTYIVFFLFGIFGDLIFGIYVTKLWSYPSYSLINFIWLYIFIYPFGGYVMLYTFKLLEHLFFLNENLMVAKEENEKYKFISKVLSIVGCLGIFLSLISEMNYKSFISYGFFVLTCFGLLSWGTLNLVKFNIFSKYKRHPLKFTFIILLVSYVQGFLHEYPNTFVYEWLYHQNFPFSDITLLDIQVLVLFLGWLALAVIPYMMYELAVAITKNNLKKFLQKLKSN